MSPCATRGCLGSRVESATGTLHTFCAWCEERVLRAAFQPCEGCEGNCAICRLDTPAVGAQSWTERALAHELPSSCIGGVTASDVPQAGRISPLPAGLPSAALSRDSLTGIGGRDDGPKTRASSGVHQVAALAATAGSRPG
jgi:hypothetical protein